ncbi:MAG: hypothetical protein U0521_29075 [Anaerolineae bacterium]
MSLQAMLDFALDATWQAGRITLGYFQTGVAVERKSDNTPVTIADPQRRRTPAPSIMALPRSRHHRRGIRRAARHERLDVDR